MMVFYIHIYEMVFSAVKAMFNFTVPPVRANTCVDVT